MQPQLAAVEASYLSAQERLHQLRHDIPADQWAVRFAPDRWSVGECVAHLNLTSAAYRPILTDAIARAKRVGGKLPQRLRRDLAGWLLWRMTLPPVRARAKTIAEFVPAGHETPDALVTAFDELQEEQIGYLRAADGLPIQGVSIVSPFNAKIKYNLYSCFTILAAHQHRHLWQAEQLWARQKS